MRLPERSACGNATLAASPDFRHLQPGKSYTPGNNIGCAMDGIACGGGEEESVWHKGLRCGGRMLLPKLDTTPTMYFMRFLLMGIRCGTKVQCSGWSRARGRANNLV
ncbi:uncharacterized protein STEHIDRAFT_109017 [Stereum hirsutum FP-91666 SS1]|uniref:uncharacterized protein n=1 Tax=Stereum hirsutum (strain FP-91666) TaxID=721885 RepID=UPI000440DCCB|nr:uncharacterized protein STEHIDRAFT_109017 [Stereum hirsutum FP-91666 SS1]EIM90548.1 hypothetical protein STEHIDRAFT_109017 [Stereum hirsutum FP-91666 SS1]